MYWGKWGKCRCYVWGMRRSGGIWEASRGHSGVLSTGGGMQEYCPPAEAFKTVVRLRRHPGCSVYRCHLVGSVKEASSAGGSVEMWEANRRHASVMKTAKWIS